MVSNTSSNYLTVCMHIVKLIMLEWLKVLVLFPNILFVKEAGSSNIYGVNSLAFSTYK